MFNIFRANENGEKIGIVALLSCAYFVCMPLSIVPLPGDISLLKAISMVTGAGLIVALFFGKNELKFNIVHLLIALYVVYSLSSLFLLRDENAWVNLRGILETSLLLFLISTRVYNQREKAAIINSWILVGVITVISMLSGSVELGESERMTIGIGGGKEDPNQLCGYFFLPILACMERIVVKSKLAIIYIVLILAMIYVAFTTGSRGGLLAIFAAIIIYVFLAIKGIANKIKIFVAMLLVLGIFFAVFYPLLPASVTERMSIDSVKEDKGSGRLDLWVVVLDAITASERSLIFGYGLGSTTSFLKNSATHSTVAHNHWLQIWCDQGFVGMMLFFLVILVAGIRTFKKQKIVCISLFGMFVLSMSLTLYAGYKPFWNILMMSAIYYRGEKT